MDRLALAERLGLALAIGLFVGIERFWASRSEPEGSRIAGVRTFALAGLLGGLWGALADIVEPLLLGFAALGFAALIIVAYAREPRAAGAASDRGITTEVAALVVFALGIVAVRIDMALAAASGVITVALLWFKADLHRTIAGLDGAEIGAAIRLLLISVVALPLLPDRGYGPGGALNPYELWWMVVLVAGVSFAGYVATRLVGGARGIVVTGLLGGLVSSTAVTVSLARMSAGGTSPDPHAAGIAAAVAVMGMRILVLLAVVESGLAVRLAPWIVPASLAAVAVALAFARRGQDAAPAEFRPENPIEIGIALRFGVLLAAMMMLAALARRFFPDGGLHALAAFSGLFDVDAITLSTARLLGDTSAAAGVIALALAVNTLGKLAITGWIADRALFGRVAIVVAATLAAGGAGAFLAR